MALIPYLCAAVLACCVFQQNLSNSEQAATKAVGSVLRKSIAPQWIGTGDRFWYQRERDSNVFEYVLVDANAASRTVYPTKEALLRSAGIDATEFKTELQDRIPRASRSNETREVWLTFANKSKTAVELFWMDTGKEQSYGLVAPSDQ